MKNKTIAIIGIGSYILSVITSAEDLEGNFVSPIVLIAISGILTIIFTVAATVRLSKGARYVSIILASSAIILFVLVVIQEVTLPKYGSGIIILLNATKIIHFLVFVYAIILLWTMAKFNKSKINESVKDFGLTPEERSLVQEDLQKGDQESAVQRIAKAEYGSENTIVTKQEYVEIMTRHATDPIFQWLHRSSRSYWAFASRVAGYFPESLRRVRSSNPFIGIARLTFVFVAGFIVVTPLYMVIGPVVQIAIIIIAVVWTCLAGIFGWHRPTR